MAIQRDGEPLEIHANPFWALTKVPDVTPGIIWMHTFNEEQILLALLRYNQSGTID